MVRGAVLVFAAIMQVAFAQTVLAQRSVDSWDLNDVSILYPLPTVSGSGDMIHLGDVGNGGPLIPRRFLDRVQRLSPFQTVEQERAGLRVVSIRIDPCFSEGEMSCRRQIRLVWQPVGVSAVSGITTIDAALHTFYDLGQNEFSHFLSDLYRLRQVQGFTNYGRQLEVHPVLLAQGLEGPFAQGLKRLILKYAGEANLTKLTFMLVRGPGIFWSFGGFDIDSRGGIKQVGIPRLGETVDRQGFANHSTAGDDFVRAMMAPAPTEGDLLGFLLQGKERVTQETSEEKILASLRAAHAFENPRWHSAGSVDCVSCHVAQSARAFGERLFPGLGALAQAQGAPYMNADYNLNQFGSSSAEGPNHTRNLRSFGYFGATPSISRRTINESAEVARILNAYF